MKSLEFLTIHVLECFFVGFFFFLLEKSTTANLT